MNIEESIQKMQKLSKTFATLESQRVNLIEQLIEYTKENLGKEECKLEGNKIKSEVDQIDEKREKIMKKIWSTSNRLMKTYFIDSAQMCKLLNAKHSGRWQVMPITGDFAEDWGDYGQSTSYVNFLCYGLTLLHTNHILNNVYKHSSIDYKYLTVDKENIIVGYGNTIFYNGSDSIEELRKRREDLYNNFNWLHYYLYARDAFPKRHIISYQKDLIFLDIDWIYKDSVNWDNYSKDDIRYLADKELGIYGKFDNEIIDTIELHKEMIVDALKTHLESIEEKEELSLN